MPRASRDRMCERCTTQRPASLSAGARGEAPRSSAAILIATVVITSATSIVSTTARSRKSSAGRPSAILLGYLPIGLANRSSPTPVFSIAFTQRSSPKWKKPLNLQYRPPIPVPKKWSRTCMPEATHRELTFAQAVREALAEEMRRDLRVCIFGEDVAEAGTPFKVLSGLVEEFGTDRVVVTPISEAGFTGLAVGAAMTGLRPVVDIMFGDFITLTMDQMVNQAAKVHYMSGGMWKVPMVMRTTMGATRRSGAQHSQSLHAWFCHVPGLKVVMPSTPYDSKGRRKGALGDEIPGFFCK